MRLSVTRRWIWPMSRSCKTCAAEFAGVGEDVFDVAIDVDGDAGDRKQLAERFHARRAFAAQRVDN